MVLLWILCRSWEERRCLGLDRGGCRVLLEGARAGRQWGLASVCPHESLGLMSHLHGQDSSAPSLSPPRGWVLATASLWSHRDPAAPHRGHLQLLRGLSLSRSLLGRFLLSVCNAQMWYFIPHRNLVPWERSELVPHYPAQVRSLWALWDQWMACSSPVIPENKNYFEPCA